MPNSLPLRWIVLLVVSLSAIGRLSAAEPQSILQLVSADAAICLEVPELDQTWAELEAGPLLIRMRAFPPFQRFLDSQGFQQWKGVDHHVESQTGTSLSVALRNLFARSLVVAIDVPATGPPRGILIGEARDAAAIESAIAIWQKLEPNAIVTEKAHRDRKYFQRVRHNNQADMLYFAVSGRWFAISDHEFLIQDVIERFMDEPSPGQSLVQRPSLLASPTYVRARQRLKSRAVAYVHINTRPWDRVLEESSKDDKGVMEVAEIWKHVTWVSASLQLDQGIVCELLIDLESALLPHNWGQIVAVASASSSWFDQIPADSLLAVTGCVELAPVIRFLVNQIPPQDQADVNTFRRISQSLFSGQDLFEMIIPVLGRDFGGFVTTRTDGRTQKMTLDGALGFSLGPLSQETSLNDIDQGLEAGLRFLAAYHSAEGAEVVTVKREQQKSVLLRSLSEDAPFPIAYGIYHDKLVVAGSRGRLQKTLGSLDQSPSEGRLKDHASRFFPSANQMIWFDAALTRNVLANSGEELASSLTFGSVSDAERLTRRFEQVRRLLAIVDSVFIAGRIESDRVSLVFGGGLDHN